MLKKNKNMFDIVITDVCMPGIDGFKLLQIMALEMDLPVISKLLLFLCQFYFCAIRM